MEVNVNWMDPVWRNWLLTWPLLLFFFSIGQELRIEFSRHTDRRHLIAPIAAALGGMAAPALIYLGFSSFTGTPKSAWGVPMATDLPFVLIALSFFPSSHVKRLRIFLLALAIADDVGSILALGVVTSSHGGIHPTIIGTILGLAWGARGFDVMSVFLCPAAISHSNCLNNFRYQHHSLWKTYRVGVDAGKNDWQACRNCLWSFGWIWHFKDDS